ncbi:MAG: hypothetical protein ACTSUL_04970 [Promethearchaeota archaeon]
MALNDYINYLKYLSKNGKLHLERSLELFDFIKNLMRTYDINLKLLEEYISQLDSIFNFLNILKLLNRKKKLIHELELSKLHEKSSKIRAISDLIKKLNEEIKKEKDNLSFLKEDYFKFKNQKAQLENRLQEFQSLVKELTNKKKRCFAEINKITMLMSEKASIEMPTKNEKDLGIDLNLTNSEKIRALQIKAKEYNYEINKAKKKIEEIRSKVSRIEPQYENLSEDYNKILEKIDAYKKNLLEKEVELNNLLKEIESPGISKKSNVQYQMPRPPRLITAEIQQIDEQLKTLSHQSEINEEFLIDSLNNIFKVISKFQEKIAKIESYQKELSKFLKGLASVFDSFRNLDLNIMKLESILNRFLEEINMKTEINPPLSHDIRDFSIIIKFLRKRKEKLKFNELTTPEKIYFLISMHVAMQVLLERKNIIFSNVYLSKQFNKKGSIYRTIKKIISVFKNAKLLKYHKLIFIIVNLEFDDSIQQAKIVKM